MWMYAIVLFIIGKLVNSQATGLLITWPPCHSRVVIVGFIGASYRYFILPTYPSDLAAIGFDPTSTTHQQVRHQPLLPGARAHQCSPPASWARHCAPDTGTLSERSTSRRSVARTVTDRV